MRTVQVLLEVAFSFGEFILLDARMIYLRDFSIVHTMRVAIEWSVTYSVLQYDFDIGWYAVPPNNLSFMRIPLPEKPWKFEILCSEKIFLSYF